MKPRIIAIDFDGTLVRHDYPDIGTEVPAAFGVLKLLQEYGHKLILHTMRSDGPEKDRRVLSEAVEFCRDKGIEFWGVNENPDQHTWTNSPKPYANIYIDDAALGCPLVHPVDGGRPYVDWVAVASRLALDGILEPTEVQ